jgi:hypothetical protein
MDSKKCHAKKVDRLLKSARKVSPELKGIRKPECVEILLDYAVDSLCLSYPRRLQRAKESISNRVSLKTDPLNNGLNKMLTYWMEHLDPERHSA